MKGRRVYIGFGSFQRDPLGGLERVSESHVKFSPLGFYYKFLLLGDHDRVSPLGWEFAWRGKTILRKLFCLVKLSKFLMRLPAQKFFVHGSPLLSLACLPTRVRVTICHHGDIEAEYRESHQFNFFLCFLVNWVIALQDFWFNSHTYYNSEVALRLRRRGKQPLFLPNFVESRFQLINFKDKKQVGSETVSIILVARWNKRKRLSDLLYWLKDRDLKIDVRIVGCPEESFKKEFNEIISTAARLSPYIRIIQYGAISDEKLVGLLGISDYFVHFSLTEGFPRAMQEAQCVGCRVLCATRYYNKELLSIGSFDFHDNLTLQPLLDQERMEYAFYYQNKYSVKRYFETLEAL